MNIELFELHGNLVLKKGACKNKKTHRGPLSKKQDCEASTIDCKYKNASTYVKLQDAYVAEKGDKLGNWNEIGYKMPSGGAFEYYDGTTKVTATDGKSSVDAASSALASGLENAWQAMPIVALNDCKANDKAWVINITANGNEGGVALYEATNASSDCLALTPSFTKLTTKKKD